MRKFCVLIAIAAATSMIALGSARGNEPQGAKAQATAKDPNYRYHNGQWWYWMSQQKNWKVWNGSQWLDYQPAASRSFSYADDSSAGTANARMFGTPIYGGFPESVSNREIIGSYGFRSAGSKAAGKH